MARGAAQRFHVVAYLWQRNWRSAWRLGPKTRRTCGVHREGEAQARRGRSLDGG